MSEFSTLVRSIKLADGRVEIVATQQHQASSDEREITLKSDELPRPELNATLAALAPQVRRLLGLPDTWASDALSVKKVVWSFSETTGVRGATLCCQAKLACADAPLVFNTPHLPFEQYAQGGNAPLMPEKLVGLLNELEAEAMAFLDGKRAQLDLLEGAA